MTAVQKRTNLITNQRKQTMKKILILTFTLLMADLAARADLIWFEGFQYSNGNVTNVSNGLWVCPGGNNGSGTDMYVNNHQLEVSASGSATVNPSRTSDDYRFLALTPGSPYTNSSIVLYSSFIVTCTNLPNGAGTYFASFYSTVSGYYGRVYAQTNNTVLPNTWRLSVSAHATCGQYCISGGFGS